MAYFKEHLWGKGFHGLASLYRKFITNFNGICTIVIACMKKKEFHNANGI
jgi:hypothetical protein